MDKTISINVDLLESQINKLVDLRNDLDTNSLIIVPETAVQGSGDVINLINEIDVYYKIVIDEYKALYDNSIQFFNNILNSVTAADNKAKENFN